MVWMTVVGRDVTKGEPWVAVKVALLVDAMVAKMDVG